MPDEGLHSIIQCLCVINMILLLIAFQLFRISYPFPKQALVFTYLQY